MWPNLGDDVVVGVGTVLDPETTRLALLAGAEFVVSPCLQTRDSFHGQTVLKDSHSGGAFTPTEILLAWEAGADAVKVFPPATKLGPEFFKDMRGPFPDIRLTPTGGVNLSNAGDFIKAGGEFRWCGKRPYR